MLKSASYIFIVSRAHGLSTRLLTYDELDSLKKTRDLQAFIDLLTKDDYVQVLSTLERGRVDAATLNRLFSKVYVDRLIYFTKISSGKFRDFMMSYVRRLEVENLRRVLRAKLRGKEISIDELIPIPRGYTALNFQELVNVSSIEDISYHLVPTMYRGAQESISIAKSINSTLPVELAVEAVYFAKLLEVANTLPSNKRVVDVLRNEYFSKLAYYIFGMKFLEAPLIVFERYSGLIARNLSVPVDFINDLLRSREDVALNIILRSRYRWLVKYIEDAVERKSVNDLYRAIHKGFRSFHIDLSKRHPLDMAYVLWYLYSVEYEYMNLIQISTAKELGIDPEEIELY